MKDFSFVLTQTMVIGDHEVMQELDFILRVSTGMIWEGSRLRGDGDPSDNTGRADLFHPDSRNSRDLHSAMEKEISADTMTAIFEGLEALGVMEGRPQDISGVPDTSICHGTVNLQGTIGNGSDRKPFCMTSWMMHSGLRGADVPVFKRLLIQLFDIFDGQVNKGLLEYV